MKTMYEIEVELSMKTQRVAYWETFGSLPNITDLVPFNYKNWLVGA